MFHPRTSPILAAVAGSIVLSTVAGIHTERALAAGRPQVPPLTMMWTDPPEAVRDVTAALRSACADWQTKRPLPVNPSPAETLQSRPAEITVCDAARNPEEVRSALVRSDLMLFAAFIGLALASFLVVGHLVRFLAMWVHWGAEAAWNTWPSFRRRYR